MQSIRNGDGPIGEGIAMGRAHFGLGVCVFILILSFYFYF